MLDYGYFILHQFLHHCITLFFICISFASKNDLLKFDADFDAIIFLSFTTLSLHFASTHQLFYKTMTFLWCKIALCYPLLQTLHATIIQFLDTIWCYLRD